LVGAVVEEAVALAQGLRQRRRRSYCGGGIGAVISSAQRLQRRRRHSVCVGGVGAMIAAMSLVGAVIAVTAAFVQRLRRWGWLATAVIAAATAAWRAAMAALAQ
jgi:hypothetical protein